MALVVTLATAPVVRRALIARNVLDVPNARSSHEAPVARGGGIACAVGVVAAFAVAQLIGDDVPWVLLVVALVLAAVGLADDLVSLPPVPRLVVQAASGAVMGWWAHPASVATVGAAAVAAVVVLLAVNVTNFMDGINGISGLTAGVWGVSTALAGASAHAEAVVALGLATAGAALGFLPFNVPVARLFLGDSGSYLLGALFAAGVLLAWQDGVALAPVLAPLALYVGDVVFTLVRRARGGEPLMQAHRDHVYQRLVRGWGGGHARVAMLATTGAAVLAAAAWLPLPVAVTLVLGIVAGYLALPRWAQGRALNSRAGARDA